MGYKRCVDCGGYSWLPGQLAGFCPYCCGELAAAGRPALVVDIGIYIKRKEQSATAVYVPLHGELRQL